MQFLVPKYIYKEAAHNINVGRFTLPIKTFSLYEPEKLAAENGTDNASLQHFFLKKSHEGCNINTNSWLSHL